jgi:hypothetical protein
MNETSHEQLLAIRTAAKRFLDACGGDVVVRQAIEAKYRAEWIALAQALIGGRTLKERAMDQFQTQRNEAAADVIAAKTG